ncbi:MAG: tripartite tricarboxylate transporter substrate binding protein [Rhizobiales bacterium]|nr:tripartite tricarboxylate transporter substrate binding protein [Hyphomicrobiales bacterium]
MRHWGWKQAGRLACLVMALSASPALAQDYPNRTIKMIVPTGAGGITDILARLVGKSLSEQFGQPVIIDNRTGAGGTIGTRAVAQAEPDGYTLLMVFPSHAANPALYASLPYDSEKDFAPISMVTRVSEILLVPNSSPAKSVKDLVDLARKEQLNYASVGVGSLAHLSTELFLTTAGVKMTHIPYRGVPQAQQAVMTGEVAAFFDTPVTALPQIRAGTVRALGISTAKRLAVAPDIPTIAEAGLAGYEVIGWNGILAPANTPRPIVDKLNKAIRETLKTPEMEKLLTEQGIEPAGNSPEEFAQAMHDDIEKWKRVTREAGIQPQ